MVIQTHQTMLAKYGYLLKRSSIYHVASVVQLGEGNFHKLLRLRGSETSEP